MKGARCLPIGTPRRTSADRPWSQWVIASVLSIEFDWSGGAGVEWISDEAKARIALLWAEGASRSLMREEVGVSRHAVFRQIRRLERRPPPGAGAVSVAV